LSQTHTYILVPFIIHDLLDGRCLCLQRIRHSWLCVLEPNMCVEKRLFSSSVVYPPLSLLPCFFFTFYVPYIYIHWDIDRFFLHLHCRQHCVVDQHRLSIENFTFFFFLSFFLLLFHTFRAMSFVSIKQIVK
jgi:hypothetical protein